jgi:cytochrome c-type biogenesis protein CcsB
MDKFLRAFFSIGAMSLGLLAFLVSIGLATFLESMYDTQTAKIIIYNASWFELLLVYLGLNLIANIFRYKMYQREKIAMFMFHLSFIVILIGAGITRYFSFEGLMLIREGEKSNFIYSSDPYVWMKINDGKLQYTFSEKHFMSEQTDNYFEIPIEFPNHKTPINIEYVRFDKKMIDSLVIDKKFNTVALEIVTDGMQSNYVAQGGFLMAGDLAISFEKKDAMPGVHLFRRGNKIMVKSAVPMRYLPMAEMQKARQSGQQVSDSLFVEIPADTLVPFQTTTLYQIGNQQIVFKSVVQNAKKMLLPSGNKNVGLDYLTLKITDGNQSKIVQLEGGAGSIPTHEVFAFGGLTYEMEYGPMKIELPFYVACRDFQLDRYPGSSSPSSFASDVTVIDEKNKHTHDQHIFMNNVMDYGGYRFFQSSYDQDEKGTRLSVNHDWLGTNVTYIGYLLMSIGMIMSLFARVGRFKELNGLLKKSREKRQSLMNILVLAVSVAFGSTGFSQEHDHADHDHSAHEQTATQQPKAAPVKAIYRVISEEHSNELATLLVQDFQGRIIPMHTMCDQLLRKIYRSNKYKDYNAVQTIMSMHMYPSYWMDQKVIQVPAVVRNELKVGEYASFRELADVNGQFKAMKKYTEAHQRLDKQRDEFDKKLIKVVEKFEVVQAIFSWQYMKLLPVKKDPTKTWHVPLSQEVMQLDSNSSMKALRYIAGLDEAAKSNQYGQVNDLLVQLKSYQRSEAGEICPSESKVNIEISYNKMGIFKNSMYSYLMLGFVLLIVFFIRIFTQPTLAAEKKFKIIGRIFIGLLIVIFAYHGTGLGFRWYISGHAPWSNGYEAVVFIAWVSMIAGFVFAKKNPVVIAVAAILAFFLIFVSEMNLLDPEITPLQPVLKSYWLMIHVAIITGSYGFLGLSAILGFINLTLYITRGTKSNQTINLNINEITYVSELTMTIGLFMLTIGTFLGGVWANESWGRYWGWDAKETWALVSVLVYAIILHLRYIPGLKSKFTFNMASLWGFSAILFTFFGVNFVLGGLHSYAQGDSILKFPSWLKYIIFGFFVFSAIAAFINLKYNKKMKAELEKEF